jgi:hypothetical protein
LEQRPGAFEHARPIRRWRGQWPPVYEQYLAALRFRLDEAEAVRRFVQVLRLHGEFPAEAVAQAVTQALAVACFHPDGVRHLLLAQAEPVAAPVAPLDLSQHPELTQLPIVAPDLACYNRLLAPEA